MLTGSAARARQTRYARSLPEGVEFLRSEWLEGGQDPVLSPHFHTQNQFQVVTSGSGRLGAHEVASGSVHYTGAYTGYGPVAAGPQGLNCFTLRPVFETGASFISTARDRMVRGPKRHMQGPPVPEAGMADLGALSAPVRVHAIAQQPDGLAALACRLPRGGQVEAPAPAASGPFQLVMAGPMRHGAGLLGVWESRYFPLMSRAACCSPGLKACSSCCCRCRQRRTNTAGRARHEHGAEPPQAFANSDSIE